MIGTNESWDNFISQHRWAVLSTLRYNGSPSNSVVAYARDGDELVVSTPGMTLKRRLVDNDRRVNLCVLSNSEPFNYVAIEALAQVQTDDLVGPTERVFANINDTEHQQPEDLPGWLIEQQRVILRLSPQRVFGVIR